MTPLSDKTFQDAGLKAGLEIWCVDNLQLVPVLKSSHGKFFSGSAYIVLNTILLKNGSIQHYIHYWLGNDAKEVDSALASDKSLELDAFLGSLSVQYREIQGQETERFLSYFKPCIIPVEGVFSLGRGHLSRETYPIQLFRCTGDHSVHVKKVPFSRTSLNHNDVFILDTASKIFLFSGCNSSIQERAKALDVVQYIRENKHCGNCEMATIEDGKFVGDASVGEFWSLFGGYAPIPRDPPIGVEEQPQSLAAKVYLITPQGKPCQIGTATLNKEVLDSNKCYILNIGSQLFVWMGRSTSVTERKASARAVEDYLRSQGGLLGTHLTFLTEGSETALFRSFFQDWPPIVEPKLYEEGREKVAEMFKQHGYDVEELPYKESQPFIDCSGTLKVWLADGDEVILLPVVEQKKLFSGDCYIVQYTYPHNGRMGTIFYAWLGCKSATEDRAAALSQMNDMVDSTKGDVVMAQIYENEEPLQFFLIFQMLIVLKGGASTKYKSSIEEKGIEDETCDGIKTALFRVQGTSLNNMQAIQVDLVSNSLNSSYCYILKTENSVFTWLGNLSSARDHHLLDRMLDLINPTWQSKLVREGSEPDAFWRALGGKAEYPREKLTKGFIEDPRLFTFTDAEDVFSNSGDFKVKEIFNFTQDDLTTEDVLVLNCRYEIYVWIGLHSNVTSKRHALTLGLNFLEADILVEDLSLETPIYVVTEGSEPPFFTCFFDWDPLKANMLGNSFERKLAILQGKDKKMEAFLRPPWNTKTASNGFRRQSVGLNGMGRRSSPFSTASGSNFEPANNRRFSSPPPVTRKLIFESSPDAGKSLDSTSSPAILQRRAEDEILQQLGQTQTDVNLLIYPYERLKVTSNDPVADIDITKREAYLSDEEFEEKFVISKRAFYELPKWRQNKLKKSLQLF